MFLTNDVYIWFYIPTEDIEENIYLDFDQLIHLHVNSWHSYLRGQNFKSSQNKKLKGMQAILHSTSGCHSEKIICAK